jgi:hypothetical protein
MPLFAGKEYVACESLVTPPGINILSPTIVVFNSGGLGVIEAVALASGDGEIVGSTLVGAEVAIAVGMGVLEGWAVGVLATVGSMIAALG